MQPDLILSFHDVGLPEGELVELLGKAGEKLYPTGTRPGELVPRKVAALLRGALTRMGAMLAQRSAEDRLATATEANAAVGRSEKRLRSQY